MKKIENDLSQGNVVRQLIRFCIPFILSSIVQNLYGMADMVVIGQFAGTASLAGVNTGASYVQVITNLAIGFCNGGTVLIGQYKGMNDRARLRDTIGTLCAFITLLALVVTAGSLLLSRQILSLMRTPVEALAEARIYTLICALGFVFIFGYNLLSAILRGVGDSRKPFLFICIACAINIALDLLLVGLFRMGALGAALATVAAQGASMLLCIAYLRRNDFVFEFSRSSVRIQKDCLKVLLRVGIPTTVQTTVGTVAFAVLTAISNEIGVATAAAMAGAQKVTLFAVLPSVALGNAIAAMCAQNFGARRKDRALETMRTGFAVIMCINVALFAVIELIPGSLMRLFGSDCEMIGLGIIYLRLCSLDFLFIPFQGALVGYLIGAGRATLPAAISICSSLLLRAPAAYLIGILMDRGITGVALATPIASFVIGTFCLIYYLSGQCGKIEPIAQENSKAVSVP